MLHKLKNKRLLIVIAIFIAVAIGAAYFLFAGNGQEQESTSQDRARSQLTGLMTGSGTANRPILGVMVENSPAARPHTGLGSAGIVFEALTEGGVTRFLALYQDDMPETVGPVRSLRVHFLNWAMGFESSIAHVGGSPEALELVDEREARSLNQFKYPEPYYRSDDRSAPHNMYARTEGLRELQQELGHDNSQFDSIPRSSDNPSQTPGATTVAINFSAAPYAVEYRYDSESNRYLRYLAGEQHTDTATGQPITAKNIVVLRTEPQETGVAAIGSGEAVVFKDGNALQARWEKSDFEDRVKVLAEDGSEVPLNRGSTWFAALPSDKQLTY